MIGWTSNMPPRREEYFADKLVVIAGGSSGIGLALAKKLSNLRAKTIVLSDKADSVSTALAQLSGSGQTVDGYVCDIGSPEAVAESCAQISAKHGAPDI